MNRPMSRMTGLAILVMALPVVATPPSASGVHISNYTMIIDPDSTDRVRVNLPSTVEYAEDVPITRGTRSASVMVFQDCLLEQNGSSGWHYHPGIVLATVAEGTIDWYDEQCDKHQYKAGDFFVENDRAIHELMNSSAAPARVILTFIVAKGLIYKISTPAPSCAAGHGLK